MRLSRLSLLSQRRQFSFKLSEYYKLFDSNFKFNLLIDYNEKKKDYAMSYIFKIAKQVLAIGIIHNWSKKAGLSHVAELSIIIKKNSVEKINTVMKSLLKEIKKRGFTKVLIVLREKEIIQLNFLLKLNFKINANLRFKENNEIKNIYYLLKSL